MPGQRDIEERIRREARVVGLRSFRTPSLESVERRRMQLWIVTAVLLVAVSAGAMVLSLWPQIPGRSWFTPSVLRVGIVVLALAFCAYAIEKELHLRRLSHLLMDERVLTTALSNRLREVSSLLEAGKAMNSVLELGSVLDVILGSALDLLPGGTGSILLMEDDEILHAACVRGNEAARDRRVRLGEGIAGRVARDREPLLINGKADPNQFPGLAARIQPVESAMCVPLINRGELLGVLSVNADEEREFTEYDLRALSLFAEQAAGAIANARLFEGERQHVLELMELDRLKSQFVALVSHELRTPLTSILGAAETIQLSEGVDHAKDLATIVSRQARRLSGMVEELLTAARLEQEETLPPQVEVDVATLARLSARDFAAAGMPVEVEAPDSLPVMGDPDSLRRVFDNLLENARKYGAPPFRVIVERKESDALVSVLDGGPGIAGADRERVFDRFARLEPDSVKPGLGLGLPIVKGLVTSCGGSVWVEDAPGGGAAFRIVLPLAPVRKPVVGEPV